MFVKFVVKLFKTMKICILGWYGSYRYLRVSPMNCTVDPSFLQSYLGEEGPLTEQFNRAGPSRTAMTSSGSMVKIRSLKDAVEPKNRRIIKIM